MAQNYSIEIPECEGAPITVQMGGVFSGIRIFHGDREIMLDKSREFVVTGNDGRNVYVKLKGSFVDPLPKLIVNGITYEFAPSIPMHALVWFGLPLLLIPLGGMLGAFIGFIAACLNLKFYRSPFPAAVRYFVGAIISVGSLVVYLLAASLIFKEKNPGLGGKGEVSSVQPGTKETLKLEHGWVAFDNSTGRDFKVTVPEWEGVMVSSEAFLVTQLPKGTYEFTFESEGAVVEQIEAEVIPNSFVLMNPGAKRTYVYGTEFYTTSSQDRPQGQREMIAGERLIYSDLGPAENFPSVIYVKSILPVLNKFREHKRTKVYRKIPEKPSAAFAIEFIKSGDTAFAEIPPKFDETCWNLIIEEAADPRVQKGLISLIEKGRYIKESFRLLEVHKVELDPVLLTGWVKGGKRDDTTRAQLATQWVVGKGGAAQVVEYFDTISPAHRQTVADALAHSGMDSGLKRQLFEKCLKVNDYQADQAARALMDTDGFPFDDSVAGLMDAHVETIKAGAKPGSDIARVRLSHWQDVVKNSTIKYAAALSPEYLTRRLLPLGKSGDYKAIEALINSGQAAILAPILTEFPENTQRNLVQLIQGRFSKTKSLSEGEMMILQKALDDKKLFQTAFQTLITQAGVNPAILGLLAARVNEEPQARQREHLDTQLAQVVVKDQKPDALLQLIKNAPTRMIVKLSVIGLNPDNASPEARTMTANQLVQIYGQLQREEQRIWLLEFLVSQWQRENPYVIGLLNQLIQTAPAKERYAAAKARMQTVCQGGGEIELVGALIAQAPKEELKDLERTYENWVSSGIGKMKPEEEGAWQRLLTLGAHPKERIAENAVSKLPNAGNMVVTPEVLSGMSDLFKKSASVKVRQRLLEKLRADTPEGIQLYGVALADTDAGIRMNAFRFLAGYYGKTRDVTTAETGVQFLRNTVASEKDAKTKTQMEQAVVSAERNPVLKKIAAEE